MAEIVQSLFGVTPEMYQQSQQARADQQALQYAQLTPFQQANYAIGRGANMLGGAIGRGLGGEDPELARITMRQQIARQINPNNLDSIKQGIEALAPNDPQGAMMLQREYQRLLESNALVGQRGAAEKASLAQAGREAKQSIPNDIQIANEIATLETSLLDIENTPDSPDRTRAKNLLNSRLSALRTLTSKGEKTVAPNIKEVGVAEKSREPVYLDVNNDQQFIYKQNADGKQVRVPFTGGVDRTTAKTNVGGVKLPEGESEFVKELGKIDAKKVGDALLARDNAAATITSLNKLASLPDNELITGQFATGRVGVTNLLQTLGLASASDARKLSGSQEYQKVAGDVILQTLGGKLGSGFSNADREFIQGLIPQLETNPDARRQLISFMQAKNQSIVEEATRLETYARTNRGLSGFVPKIPMSVAPSQPRPFSGLTDEQLAEKIRAAQAQQRR
jgi:hypothetical protein